LIERLDLTCLTIIGHSVAGGEIVRYVRPEDEPPIELVEDGDGGSPAANEPKETTQHAVITIGAGPAEVNSEGEEDDAVKPLSERLITELTTHRTLARSKPGHGAGLFSCRHARVRHAREFIRA
jgi:hypothetical protein